MRPIVPFLLYLLINCSSLNGQNQANIWYFGSWAGLDFTSGTPVALTDGMINIDEGCSSVCDSAGNLLFYTNGITVWNRNHQVMQNGTGLYGGFGSSTQAALIVRKPGSSTLYYIFTSDNQNSGLCDCVAYSIVDMSQQSGLGAVTATKNVSILTNITEKLCAVADANGTGFWILAHPWNSNAFNAYHLTASGLNTTPVVSNTGMFHTGGFPYVEKIGYMKASPDGRYLACANTYRDTLQLFDFNNLTGQVSNPRTIQFPRVYGIEFSPSSEFMYAASNGFPTFYLKQFNISSGIQANIIASTVDLTTGTLLYGALQLGPDNKIYVDRYNGAYIDQITNPDLPGLACGYIDSAIYLAGKTMRLGLPNFSSDLFCHAPPTPAISGPDTVCVQSQTLFSIDSIIYGVTYNWSIPSGWQGATTGDSVLLTNNGSPGLISVSASSNCGVSENALITISIDSVHLVLSVSDPDICAGDTIILTASGADMYTWYPINLSGASISISLNQSDTITVIGSNSNQCLDTEYQFIQVNLLPVVQLDLSAIDTLCVTSETVALNTASPPGGIFSGPFVSGSNFNPASAGTGTFQINYTYSDSNGCVSQAYDSIYVDLCLNVTGISANSISIYPNPGNGLFTFSAEEKIETLVIYNSLGEKISVHENVNAEHVKVDLSTQSNGIYFYSLIKISGEIDSGSILKQN